MVYVVFTALPASKTLIKLDFYTFFFSYTPRLIKVYKKIHKFSNVISFFCTNEWTFTNKNVQKLWNKLPAADRDLFYFDMKQVDWIEYSRYYMRGMRIYLFKDDLSTVEAAKRKWNR